MSAAPPSGAVAASSARWLAAGQFARVALQLAAVALLSRLLVAADFGLMAMSLTVTNFAMLWRDMGTAAAIVQRAELDERTINGVFRLNVGVGVAIAAAILLLRGPIASGFGAPELAGLLVVLAAVFPLQGLAAVHQALLERASRFRRVMAVELGAGAAGLAAAVWAASAGLGVYSLAVQALATASVSVVALWVLCAWRPRLRGTLADARGLLRFSGHLLAFNLINYFTRNLDGLVIGRVLGAGPLGPYSLATRVVLFPVQNLTWVAARALLPVMSRHQGSTDELARLYLRSLSLIAFVSAPLMAGLWALREPFVRVVFGDAWAVIADLLAWLAPVGFLQSIASMVGAVLMARGRTDVLMRIGVASLVLFAVAFTVGVRWGITAVAASYFVANLLNAALCLWATAREIELPGRRVVRCLAGPVAAAALMLLLLVPLIGSAALVRLDGWQQLLLSIPAAALVYALGARVVDRDTFDAALRLLRPREGS